MRNLFDLAGNDPDLRFSPYCWRTKYSLAHKGLPFDTTPWRFTEKDRIEETGQGRVPVLVDGDRTVHDSFQIALYLDETYTEEPALMPGASGKAAASFVQGWCDSQLLLALRNVLLLDVYNNIHPKDQAYFRESREKATGQTLEEVCKDRQGHLDHLHSTLKPAESTLSTNKFLGGDQPNFSDYILFGSLMWAHCICTDETLRPDNRVFDWFQTLLDLHDGLGRNAPTVRD